MEKRGKEHRNGKKGVLEDVLLGEREECNNI